MEINEQKLNHLLKESYDLSNDATSLFIRAIRVLNSGHEALSFTGACHWMVEPNSKLSGKAPIQYLESDVKCEKVLSIIASIKHGGPF